MINHSGKDKGLRIPAQFKGVNIFRFENRLMSSFVISEVIGKLKPQVKHQIQKTSTRK